MLPGAEEQYDEWYQYVIRTAYSIAVRACGSSESVEEIANAIRSLVLEDRERQLPTIDA